MHDSDRPPEDEDTLRQFGKDLTTIIPSDDETSESISAKTIKLQATIDHLLNTASRPEATTAQRTAACNPLCAILEACHASQIAAVNDCILERNVWSRAFTFFLEWFEVAKPRSMRQLLLVLTAILRQDVPTSAFTKVRDDAVRLVLHIITRDTAKPQLKPSLQALEHFLQKKFISIKQLLELHGLRQVMDTSGQGRPCYKDTLQELFHILFNLAPNNEAAHAVGRLLATITSTYQKQRSSLGDVSTSMGAFPIWSEPLLESFAKNSEHLQSYRNHILPGLFSIDLHDYLRFLRTLDLESYVGTSASSSVARHLTTTLNAADNVSLLFASLQTGKEQGLIVDIELHQSNGVRIRGKNIELPDAFISRLLGDLSPTIRLSALSLLITSASITRPFTIGSLRSLHFYLPSIIADTDANVRSELLSLVQKLFDRLRATTAAMSKESSRAASIVTGKSGTAGITRAYATSPLRLLKAHYDFLRNFLESRIFDLRPTAPYQLHYVSLRCLTIALKSGLDASVPQEKLSKQAKGLVAWPYHLDIFSDQLLRALFDLMMNAFDDVRAGASQILSYHLIRSPVSPSIRPWKSSASFKHLSSSEQSQKDAESLLSSFVEKAERIMLATGRADHSDGVARAFDLVSQDSYSGTAIWHDSRPRETELSKKFHTVRRLVEQLEFTISIAKDDMLLAVSQYPMHGICASIKYILEQPNFYSQADNHMAVDEWKLVHKRIFVCMHMVWACVKEVLCNEAPEGHLPQELDGDQELSTKDVLSYSWRALKESSLLLRTIVLNATFEQGSHDGILDSSDFKILGELSFVQLTELRHRGAFSTVAQTFAAFCSRCTKERDTTVREFPSVWFKVGSKPALPLRNLASSDLEQETMRAIQNKSTVLTRRSGGIPSLMIGIVAAAPDSELFHLAMKELHEQASEEGVSANIEESNLPQVHALNCLKDVFTNTKLGQASEAYIGKTLIMAGTKLESNIWSIRNCGLMLFKALIDRLLGYDDTQGSVILQGQSKLSYDRFPGLLDILIESLKPSIVLSADAASDHTFPSPKQATLSTEAVFPALQILQRAPPPAPRMAEARDLISKLIQNVNWHVRDMAARTLARTFAPDKVLQTVEVISPLAYSSHNQLHGKLLALKFVIQIAVYNGMTEDTLATLCTRLFTFQGTLYNQSSCPVTKAAYIDALLPAVEALLKATPQYLEPSRPNYEERKGLFNSITSFFAVLSRDSVHNFQQFDTSFSSGDHFVRSATILRQSTSTFYVTCQTLIILNLEALDERYEEQYAELYRFVSLTRNEPELASSTIITLRATFERSALPQSPKLLLEMLSILKGHDAAVDNRTASARLAGIDFFLRRYTLALASADAEFPREMIATLEESQKTSTFGATSVHENALRLAGPMLDVTVQAHRNNSTLKSIYVGHLSLLAKRLQCSLKDTRPFSERQAAVESLNGLNFLWTLQDETLDEARIQLALVTYDALNDDDDDIRDVASTDAAKILCNLSPHRSSRSYVPVLASAKLAQRLAAKYPTSSTLIEEARRRLLGDDRWHASRKSSFSDTFTEAREIDTSLFVQERQNLFIDDTREALVWSRVLTAVNVRALPRDLVYDITEWVMNGLSSLTSTTNAERDGPLGWTSKPEVFVLGMRVLYGAEVLLNWRQTTKKVPRKGTEIKKALIEFVHAGKSSDLHEMWLHTAEKILEKAALRKLVTVKAAMDTVVGRSL